MTIITYITDNNIICNNKYYYYYKMKLIEVAIIHYQGRKEALYTQIRLAYSDNNPVDL